MSEATDKLKNSLGNYHDPIKGIMRSVLFEHAELQSKLDTAVKALEETKEILDEMFNYSKWYCPECAALIPSEKVTFDESCEDCETYLTPHQETSPYFVVGEALEKVKGADNE